MVKIIAIKSKAAVILFIVYQAFLLFPRVGVFSLHKTSRIKKTGQEFQKNFYIFSKKEKWHFRNGFRHFKSAISAAAYYW